MQCPFAGAVLYRGCDAGAEILGGRIGQCKVDRQLRAVRSGVAGVDTIIGHFQREIIGAVLFETLRRHQLQRNRAGVFALMCVQARAFVNATVIGAGECRLGLCQTTACEQRQNGG